METDVQGKRRAGFTLMEVMVASAISVIVLGGVVVAFIEGLQVWQQEEIKNELNFDLEAAMERIRVDLRLSSVGIGLMSFYPADAADYTAISLPLSIPTNGGRLLPRDTNTDLLVWNETVIYHVRPGSPDQLLRTSFAPRKPDATPAELYQQLCDVVAATSEAELDAAELTGEEYSSRVVFRNLVDLKFRPPSADYDCYAATTLKATPYNWGSIVLDGGSHDLAFTVIGKNANADSNGYKVVIDKFSLSGSASERDAELVDPEDSHPASPYYAYDVSAGGVSTEYQGVDWIGYAGLTFTPVATGDQITFYVDNDLWCDNNFDTPAAEFKSNCLLSVETNLFTPVDVVVKMDKGTAWTASSVGAEVAPLKYMVTTTITNFLYGGTNDPNSTITKNGCWARLYLARGEGFSCIFTNVQIVHEDGAAAAVTFNNGQSGVYMPYNGPLTTNSDWVSMWETFKDSNYMVRFETVGEFSDEDYDMLVASVDGGSPSIRRYLNAGTEAIANFEVNGSPNWQGISWGASHPSITLADIDTDGDLDMFAIGNTGILYYRNTGDCVTAKMGLTAMAGLNGICSCGGGKPTLADLDNDGDLDIVWCHKHTTSVLTVLRNDGSYTAPNFVNVGNLLNSVGGTIYMEGRTDGRWNSPEFADIDGDGDADLFVGSGTNTLGFWENTTTNPSAYQFTFRTNAYADVQQPGATDYSPKFVDIDADGDLDLFIGNSLGEIWFYPNTGTVSSALWDTNAVTPWRTVPGGTFAVPVFINLDGEVNAPAQWLSGINDALPYSSVDGVGWRRVVGLERLEVGYPRFARFRSGIFDTTVASPDYQHLNYTQYELYDEGGDVQVRVRSGTQPDLSDLAESDWSDWFTDNEAQSLAALPVKGRYLQYECLLECGRGGVTTAHTNEPTAMLQDVTIDWPAESGLVDLVVDFGKGPDCGIVRATVDGQPFVKSVQVEMTIYKAGRLGTNTASGVLEIKPLNTGR